MSVSPSTNTSLPVVARQLIDAIPAPCVSIIRSLLPPAEAQIHSKRPQCRSTWVKSDITSRSAGRCEEVPSEDQQQLVSCVPGDASHPLPDAEAACGDGTPDLGTP